MCFRIACVIGFLAIGTLAVLPSVVSAQDEGLPAIAREVYQPRTGLPPAPVPRVVTERLVTEPPIVAPPVVDDSPNVAAAVVAPTVAETVVTRSPVVAPAVVAGWPSVFARYSFGFYDDGNADDNWYYDYYEVPRAAVVVKPTVAKPVTDARPGYRTNWTYAPAAEQGLFSW